MKAYYVADDEIYAAHSASQAADLYFNDTGEMLGEFGASELSDAQLDQEMPERDENEALTGSVTTLRRYLLETTEPGWLAGGL